MNRFQQIYDYIDKTKPETILEIGTWNGRNAHRMLKEGAKNYIGFDIFEEGDEELDKLENNAKTRVTMEDAKKFLKDYPNVELIKGNTRNTLPAFVKGKKPFVDVAVIDGGHSKGTIKNDLMNILKIVNLEGVIFIDDYYYGCPQTHIGAQTVLGEINIKYTVLPLMDKANDGSLIKIVRIDMKDVPRNDYDIPEDISWRFSAPVIDDKNEEAEEENEVEEEKIAGNITHMLEERA